MKRPSLCLQVEELEGRTLLTALTLSSPILGPSLIAAATPSKHHHHAYLGGRIHGLDTAEQSNPDAGTSYSLEAAGQAGSFGQVTVSGSLHTPGFIASGQAGGTLTLTNTNGSVTLQLVGPQENGFGPLPDHFMFTVVQGTRAYQHFKVSGSIDLHMHPLRLPGLAPTPFTLTIHQTPAP